MTAEFSTTDSDTRYKDLVKQNNSCKEGKYCTDVNCSVFTLLASML